jgi:hypothetical protein
MGMSGMDMAAKLHKVASMDPCAMEFFGSKKGNCSKKNAAWLPGSGQSGGWIMFAKEMGGCLRKTTSFIIRIS